jgi:hypothetical protein
LLVNAITSYSNIVIHDQITRAATPVVRPWYSSRFISIHPDTTIKVFNYCYLCSPVGSGHSDGEDGEESNQGGGYKNQETPKRSFAQMQLEALENEFNKTNYHDVFSRDEFANRMEYAEQLRSQVCIKIDFLYTSFQNL